MNGRGTIGTTYTSCAKSLDQEHLLLFIRYPGTNINHRIDTKNNFYRKSAFCKVSFSFNSQLYYKKAVSISLKIFKKQK